jgi:hypothetical protein
MRVNRQLRSRWLYLRWGESSGYPSDMKMGGLQSLSGFRRRGNFFASAWDRIPIPGFRSPRLKAKIFRFKGDRLNWYSWQHCAGRSDGCSGCAGEGADLPPARRIVCENTVGPGFPQWTAWRWGNHWRHVRCHSYTAAGNYRRRSVVDRRL